MGKTKPFIIIFSVSILITCILHIIATPFWGVNRNLNMNVSSYEGIITMLILPIILISFHFIVFKRFKIKVFYFLLNLLFIFFCIWLSSYFHLLNWGYSIGNIENPDNGTNEVIGFTKIIGYIVSTILFIFLYFRLKKYYNNPEKE
jgi:hypothetical protein